VSTPAGEASTESSPSQRRDGRWQITHEHQSVPFEMDGSFTASIDLQP